MISPHGRDVGQIRGHSLPVDRECEIGGENVLADAISVEAGCIRQRVDTYLVQIACELPASFEALATP